MRGVTFHFKLEIPEESIKAVQTGLEVVHAHQRTKYIFICNALAYDVHVCLYFSSKFYCSVNV